MTLEKIKVGKKILDTLIEKNKIENRDTIILFPHMEGEINIVGCALLPIYIKKRNPHKVIILFTENAMIKVFEDPAVLQIQLNTDQINCLMAYYSLCNLGYNFIVMSLTEPYGRFGEKVIERNNISLKEVVAYGIYGLSREEANEESIKQI